MKAKSEIPDAVRRVTIDDGFWSQFVDRTRTATLSHVLSQCEAGGALQNLDIAAGRSNAAYEGGPDRDSNLFKSMEGAAYSLALSGQAELDTRLDAIIEKIAAAQEPSGYLCSYFTATRPNEKYTDLHRSHELYCAGHLIEAAVAHFHATGKRTLLNVAIKNADHLDATFGYGKFETVPGHQEVELALVRLYHATQDRKYLNLCRYFVDMRGNPDLVKREYAGKPVIESERHPGRNRPPAYRQDHLPAVQQREPAGHAVRAGYFYTAMADLAIEYESADYATAVDSIWDHIAAQHTFITGGVGTHQHRDEGFGDPYRLPNDSAYCETCGGIALLLFSHRMNLLHGDTRYADLIETILYNHVLSSTDRTGCGFHYRNPLESTGNHRRHAWPNPACCPTNVVRLIPQLGQYVYTTAERAIYVDQFVNTTATMEVDGTSISLHQQSNYPWDGQIQIDVTPSSACEFALHVRIPGWVDGRPIFGDLYRTTTPHHQKATITVNGQPIDVERREKGYCVIRRLWQGGDRVVIDLPMPIRRIVADHRVESDRGKVALMRGPLVYCVEGVDHACDIATLTLPADASLETKKMPDLYGGIIAIERIDGPLTAIPYFAWNNRETGPMLVWLPAAPTTPAE